MYTEALIAGILIPFLVFGASFVLKRTFPKTPNSIYGFKTKRASASAESWEYANNRFANLMMRVAVFTLMLNVLLLCINQFAFNIDRVFLTYFVGLDAIIALFIVVFIVQRELKVRFIK